MLTNLKTHRHPRCRINPIRLRTTLILSLLSWFSCTRESETSTHKRFNLRLGLNSNVRNNRSTLRTKEGSRTCPRLGHRSTCIRCIPLIMNDKIFRFTRQPALGNSHLGQSMQIEHNFIFAWNKHLVPHHNMMIDIDSLGLVYFPIIGKRYFIIAASTGPWTLDFCIRHVRLVLKHSILMHIRRMLSTIRFIQFTSISEQCRASNKIIQVLHGKHMTFGSINDQCTYSLHTRLTFTTTYVSQVNNKKFSLPYTPRRHTMPEEDTRDGSGTELRKVSVLIINTLYKLLGNRSNVSFTSLIFTIRVFSI